MKHFLTNISILTLEKSAFELTDSNNSKYKEEEKHDNSDIQDVRHPHEQWFDCDFQAFISSNKTQDSQNFKCFKILIQRWSRKQRKNDYCKVKPVPDVIQIACWAIE